MSSDACGEPFCQGNVYVHGETSGERERAELTGLSLDPTGSNASRPSSTSPGPQQAKVRHLAPNPLNSREGAARPFRRMSEDAGSSSHVTG